MSKNIDINHSPATRISTLSESEEYSLAASHRYRPESSLFALLIISRLSSKSKNYNNYLRLFLLPYSLFKFILSYHIYICTFIYYSLYHIYYFLSYSLFNLLGPYLKS